MCGRYNLRSSPAELQAFFDLFREPEVLPRFNIAPLQSVVTVNVDDGGKRIGQTRQWGLIPSWSKSADGAARLINARSESAAEKPAFRSAFRKRRCLIPASGFYEWERLDKRTKQPWHIALRSGQPLAFAGLWESWPSSDRGIIESYTILTTTANAFMAELHDRMPVILSPQDFSAWLDPAVSDPEKLAPLLVPCRENWLERYPVSQLVNSVRNESPECLKRVPPRRTLFD